MEIIHRRGKSISANYTAKKDNILRIARSDAVYAVRAPGLDEESHGPFSPLHRLEAAVGPRQQQRATSPSLRVEKSIG